MQKKKQLHLKTTKSSTSFLPDTLRLTTPNCVRGWPDESKARTPRTPPPEGDTRPRRARGASTASRSACGALKIYSDVSIVVIRYFLLVTDQ